MNYSPHETQDSSSTFQDQVVLITGGTGGMGSSHVRGFHDAGATVVVLGTNLHAAQELAAELGDRALGLQLDVTDEDGWSDMVGQVEKQLGPVSVLVNNAGVQNPAALIEDTDLKVWEQTMSVNVTGAFLGIRAVVPSMRRAGGGSIVNVASTMAHGGTPFFAPYVSSKWAVRGLTKTAALELGRDRIRVNSIHPGVVSTPLINTPTAPGESAIIDSYSPAPYAVPRVAQPEEVTRLLLFVASPAAAYATGAEFVLDGGLLLGPALAAEAGDHPRTPSDED